MANINKFLKQAKKMQDDMAKAQNALSQKETEITAGGGMIKVRITGDQRIIGLNINPEIVDPEDIETLEDVLLAAVNQALEESQKIMRDEMGKVTGGMNIPGLGF